MDFGCPAGGACECEDGDRSRHLDTKCPTDAANIIQVLTTTRRSFSIRKTWVSWFQGKLVPEYLLTGFFGAKDDAGGGDNWSYKTCKASVKSSPLTNQHSAFSGRMSFQPNVSEH